MYTSLESQHCLQAKLSLLKPSNTSSQLTKPSFKTKLKTFPRGSSEFSNQNVGQKDQEVYDL